MRLIDADALLPMMKYATTDSEIGIFPIKIGFSEIVRVIDEAPTIDAIPVSFIQQRIDHLHELAEYEFEYNGGYVGATHIAWHELEKILIEWEEQRDANQDKTD